MSDNSEAQELQQAEQPVSGKLTDDMFVTSEIHDEVMRMPDGRDYIFHFCEISAEVVQKYRRFFNDKDDAVQARAQAFLIAQGLVEPDGSPAITEAKARKLKPKVADAFANKILELAGFGEGK